MNAEIVAILFLCGFVGFLGVLIWYKLKDDKRVKKRNQQAYQELLATQERYNKEVEVLQDLYEKNGVPAIESDMLLKKGELLHAKFSGSWNELRRHTTNISYGGFSTRIPIMKGLAYRAGSYEVDRQTSDIQTTIDRGDLYVTNKAIFFRG